MKQLRVELIFANSPQAKGRVERVNKTLQDRLTKEMRLRGINNIKEANKYLPEFVTDFNQRFAVKPANPDNAHRPLLPSEKRNLDKILSHQDVRTLSKNLQFQYKNVLYQIITKKQAYTLRHSKVLVIRNSEDQVRVYYKGKELKYKTVSQQTKSIIASSKIVNHLLDQIMIKEKNKKDRKHKDENTIKEKEKKKNKKDRDEEKNNKKEQDKKDRKQPMRKSRKVKKIEKTEVTKTKKKTRKLEKTKKVNRRKKHSTTRRPADNHPWRGRPRALRDRTFLLGNS